MTNAKRHRSCNEQSAPPKGCDATTGCENLPAATLKEAIGRYRQEAWKDSHVQCCIKQESLAKAIKMAANANTEAIEVAANGKKADHQRRLSIKTLGDFGDQLVDLKSEIEKITSFDKLIKLICDKKCDGIGELAIYDTALRIGAYKGIEPEKVYLHRGALIGAKNLLGKINENPTEKEVFVAEEPAFSRLSPADIENFLCIHKDAPYMNKLKKI